MLLQRRPVVAPKAERAVADAGPGEHIETTTG
jgi:hypothetical protein